MQLFVKSLRGPTLVFQVSEETTVEELKQMVHDREGIPADRHRLVIGGRLLEDGKTLKEMNIENETTITIYINNNPVEKKQEVGTYKDNIWVKTPNLSLQNSK